MFDRTYFTAGRANGFESCSDSPPVTLLTPAGLTDVARRQWVADFKALVAYTMEQECVVVQELVSNSRKKNVNNDFVLSRPAHIPPEVVSTAVDEVLKPLKPPHPLHQANQELTAAKKKLANENASTEAKLQRIKATLSTLTLKVERTLPTSQVHSDLMQRLSTAVTDVLQHSAKENTTQDAAVHPEVAMLTEQLKKLDQANGRLQNELVDLRQKLVGARQKKKGA